MNLEQIKRAVDAGKVVHWGNAAYRVICDSSGEYLIGYRIGHKSENYIGLTHRDGVTLNGRPDEFFTA